MSNLVKPHLISVAIIVALLVIISFWPTDKTVTNQGTVSSVPGSVALPEATEAPPEKLQKTGEPVVPEVPALHVIQPDPGLSDNELFHQAVNARRCRDVPKTTSELRNWLARARKKQDSYGRIVRVRNAFESCQHIDIGVDYHSTFRMLAQKGHESSLWQFWHLTEDEIFRLKGISPKDSLAMSKARQAFLLSKYRFAEQQLLSGNERAMMRLMNAYHHLDPDSGSPNPVRSLALANLVMGFSQKPDNIRRADRQKRYLESRLSSDEVQQAAQLAQDIAKQIPS